jgi:ribA/ribD-fused uncharacterized protein
MKKMKVTDKGVYFWSGIYSQWYKSNFEIDGMKFTTAEQYMMYKKALLFEDEEVGNAIMRTNNPREQKALGRKVRNFDADTWNENCREYVYEANYAKFTQDPNLLEQLMETGDRILVEASPQDKIWGIGLHFDDERVEDESQWQGTNWLGEAIMRVRKELHEETANV